jgi:hypothetical protein
MRVFRTHSRAEVMAMHIHHLRWGDSLKHLAR